MNRSLLATALLLAMGSTSAATIAVTRFDDPAQDGCAVNGCSLREAVQAAATLSGADTVTLPSGNYVLRAPMATAPVTVEVASDVTLQGAGSATTSISEVGTGSLFWVHDATVAFAGVTLRNATSNGAPGVGGLGGGAIRAERAALSLAGVRLYGNSARDGGGLHLTDTAVELSAAVIESHKAANAGGGIWAKRSPIRMRAGSVMRLNFADKNGGAVATDDEVIADDDCLITDNHANRGGAFADNGGAYAVRGVATANGTGLLEISDNSVEGLEPMWNVPNGHGGGAHSYYGLTLERVALIGNTANAGGGGVSTSTHDLVMRDSRVAMNHSDQWAGGISASGNSLLERVSVDSNSAGWFGGAMRLGNNRVSTLSNVDVYNNTAPERAGIENFGTMTLTHGTVWNNLSDAGRDVLYQGPSGAVEYRNSLMLGRCTGTTAAIVATGNNLRTFERVGSCGGGVPLTPLTLSRGTFGGLFEISGTASSISPLVNAGSSSFCLARDIRDASRDAKCDIGAFEFGAVAP